MQPVVSCPSLTLTDDLSPGPPRGTQAPSNRRSGRPRSSSLPGETGQASFVKQILRNTRCRQPRHGGRGAFQPCDALVWGTERGVEGTASVGGDSYNSRSSRSNKSFQLGSALRSLGTIVPRVAFDHPQGQRLRQPTLVSSGPSFVIQTKLFRATAAAAAAIWTAGWVPKRAGSAPRKYLPTTHTGNPIHPPLSVPHIQRSCLEQQPGRLSPRSFQVWSQQQIVGPPPRRRRLRSHSPIPRPHLCPHSTQRTSSTPQATATRLRNRSTRP